jgi:hypothetical protein
MTAKLTPSLRLRNAQDFLENLVGHPITPPAGATSGSHDVDRSHYMFIGRTKEWPTVAATPGVEAVSELSPPTPTNTIADERETRDHIIALKKVRDVDASLCIKRFDWDASGNTIYKPYDVHDSDLFNHPTPAEIAAANANGGYDAGSFWVITDEYHIFKCLSNGNGKKSTAKPILPTGDPYICTLEDGYSWKYLATVSQFQTQYFLTNQWLPVKKLTAADTSNQWNVQSHAVDGSIDSYILKNAGTGYVNTHTGAFESVSGNTAQLDSSASTELNAYYDCAVWILGVTGQAAGPYQVTAYDGDTRTITITREGWTANDVWTVLAGTSYQILPRAIISGNGVGAKAKVFVDAVNQKISSVVPTFSGSGYTYATVEIVGGKSTSGTLASVVAEIAPKGGHGSDIERELNACYVMLTSRLVYDDLSGDFPLANDYRQVGLVRDVQTLASGSPLANALTLRATSGLRLSSVSAGTGGPFAPDELITGTAGGVTAHGRVVSFEPDGDGTSNATLYYYQDFSTDYVPFEAGMQIVSTPSLANANVVSLVVPEVDRLSGDLLYIDNRRSVLRAPNQTEVIRAVIKF